MLATIAPGIQIPDGRPYPAGLVAEWKKQTGAARFPLAFKVRQNFDTGWRVALVEAMKGKVPRLHVALIPNWSAGQPDWKWIKTALKELRDLVTVDGTQVFCRLGNFRDGEGLTFVEHAAHERTFGAMLPVHGFLWAVGDDRGLVAALDGWKIRKGVYAGGPLPVMIEAQPYGETSGMSADHPGMFKAAMQDADYWGDLAFVEFHRWFVPKGKDWNDFTRLIEPATGEYLLLIHRACAAAGIGVMIFTGDTVFVDGYPQGDLNGCGLALFDKPRKVVKAWKPPLHRTLITSTRLS